MNDIPDEIKKEFYPELNIPDNTKDKVHTAGDIESRLTANKSLIYTVIFYGCGTAIGSVLYKLMNSDALNKLLKPSEESLTNLFYSNICLYLSMFLVTVFLAFCLIGYPVINIIPTVLGVNFGMRVAYFYINYNAKGVGYTILMIAPFCALFMTVLAFTIQTSSAISKDLVAMTKNRNADPPKIKPSMKKFLIYGALIIICSFASAGIETLLKSVVTI